jgi:RNA polymerase sigma-70 factor (ECF subfamily)
MPDDPNTPDPWSLAAVEQNRRWLLAFLLSASGDRAAAEDLVQETFRIAYEKRREFAPGTSFGGWLRGIARNLLLRHFEQSRRAAVLVGDAMGALEQAAGQSEERLLDPDWASRRLAALKECLARLTTRVRQVLQSRYAQGLNAQEIARHLGMSVAAVNVAAFRARETLAACVERRMTSS